MIWHFIGSIICIVLAVNYQPDSVPHWIWYPLVTLLFVFVIDPISAMIAWL